MERNWTWATIVVHLLLLVSAACLSNVEEKERYRLDKDGLLRRTERAVTAPGKISCELSPWGQWSSCQPCKGIKYRSRGIVRFGQFGGKTCTDILSEEQPCPVTGDCEEEPINCGINFQCDDGHCINRRLTCNNDNDCGDFSDEDECERIQSPCKRELETLETGQNAGSGVNILGMEPRRSPFNNNFYNGVCDSVYNGIQRAHIRRPWNIGSLYYQTQAQQLFTTEVYESSSDVVKKIFEETNSNFNIGLSLKLNLKKVTASAGLNYGTNKTKSLYTLLSYNQSETNEYFRVKGRIEIAQFNMRSRRYELDRDFILDLKELPTEYDKGVYFKILEDYGTHYTSAGTLGGEYQLVYVLDKSEMIKDEITTEKVKECLGFGANFNLHQSLIKGQDNKTLEFTASINKDSCKKVTKEDSKKDKKKPLIKDVVSFVSGGDILFLTKLNVLLSEGNKAVDASVYVDWARSLINSAVLVKWKLLPIYGLVPLSMRNSTSIRRNLERAIGDYEAEYSVCKCQPCMNGGTVMLLNGQCYCLCTHTFQGEACQIPKVTHQGSAGYTDGHWSCWSEWSGCSDGQRQRTRQCLGRQGEGTECQGESRSLEYC
ncbi:complement component C9 [Pristis pectinata]|uniref:complement component C9 n=1 Tax=Pristis pectinata TaxID=685728 RepID=UPI00223CEAD3|nr:complement component C9 [Pristis pectinata]XP_051876447.1 complement component C9 [Pristis pectinata]